MKMSYTFNKTDQMRKNRHNKKKSQKIGESENFNITLKVTKN